MLVSPEKTEHMWVLIHDGRGLLRDLNPVRAVILQLQAEGGLINSEIRNLNVG